MAATEVRRVEYMGRRAVALSNERVVAVVEAGGGIVPVFGARRGASVLNAHWIPDFRDSSGAAWNEAVHGPYWKAPLLRRVAGDFPCTPSFGDACVVDGVAHPVHGWGANEEWRLVSVGEDPETGAAWARSRLESPAPALPLVFEKLDLILPGEHAYHSVLRIRNGGATPQTVNLVRHNTVGPPFLAAGCRLFVSAERFMAAPAGTEFEPTGRLALGAEFDELARAPLRAGGTADLTEVPGMIGHSDFVMGAIPERRALGWSCVVNPVLKLAYLCFFPGPAELPAGEVAASFNELWLQHGGRSSTPWALYDGGADRVFCLGSENGVSSFNLGLGYARANPTLLGRPTVFEVPAGGARTFFSGTALVPLDDALAWAGVRAVEAEGAAAVLQGAKVAQRAPVGADFARARAVTARVLLPP
jgi:hypothetical protein